MKLLGLKEKDEQRLKQGLDEIRELHQLLSKKYSLRSDLTDLNDRRYSLNALFRDELEKLEEQRGNLEKNINDSMRIKGQLEESLEAIQRISETLKEDESGVSLYGRVSELLDDGFVSSLEEKADNILVWHKNVFEGDSERPSLVQSVESKSGEISKQYNKLFVELGKDGENLVDSLRKSIEEIDREYRELFSKVDGRSKTDRMEEMFREIEIFHDKVYGNEEKNKKSLQKELDARLEALRQVEKKAKSVINLSSEAGLAGGFVVKGSEAKVGRALSAIVFASVVIGIFAINFYIFDFSDLKSLSWDAFMLKVMINAPLVWAATIANINLNRFSRLEQEYSHKEALAKSYERYKEEIEQLEQLGIEGANELKMKLLEINLEALKVNPASSSDKAKSDISLRDIIRTSEDPDIVGASQETRS